MLLPALLMVAVAACSPKRPSRPPGAPGDPTAAGSRRQPALAHRPCLQAPRSRASSLGDAPVPSPTLGVGTLGRAARPGPRRGQGRGAEPPREAVHLVAAGRDPRERPDPGRLAVRQRLLRRRPGEEERLHVVPGHEAPGRQGRTASLPPLPEPTDPASERRSSSAGSPANDGDDVLRHAARRHDARRPWTC